MNKIISISLITATIFLFNGCKDIFEPDISKSTLVLLAPADNATAVSSTNTFWWDPVEDALQYNFQIVSPNFSAIQQLVENQTLTGTQIDVILSPGTYQWRVRAENGSSMTEYTTRTLTIDSTGDLSQLTIVLATPNDSIYSNNMTNTFSWDILSAATDYTIEIGQPDFNNIILTQSTTTNSYMHTFTAEGDYQWRVRGENAFSVSPYTSRYIFIDTMAPVAPTLTSPVNNDTSLTTAVNLSWTSEANILGDSLFIYSPDSLTLESGFPLSNSSGAYTFNGVSATNYYWKVKSYDKAGNSSVFSVLSRFYIQ